MLARSLTMALLVGGIFAGCNGLLGNDAWTLASDGSTTFSFPEDGGDGALGTGDADRADAQTAAPDSSATAQDSGARDTEAPVDSSSSGLDPCLVVPDAAAPTCWPINGSQMCPGFGFCAIAGPTSDAGLCTNCAAQGSCSGPLKSACQVNEDCDDLFQCYCGQCRTLCELDSGECGSMCTGVGNDTWGVCLN